MFIFDCRKIRVACENMDRRMRTGATAEDAWNQTSIELAQAAEAHCRVFLATVFIERVRNLPPTMPEPLQEVFMQLCQLYTIYWVLQRLGDFLRVKSTFNFCI